jgi:hypothetical protein
LTEIVCPRAETGGSILKLPKEVYVAIRGDDESTWLECARTPEDAIQDDGPTEIGTYRLVEVNELRKCAVVTKKKRGGRR